MGTQSEMRGMLEPAGDPNAKGLSVRLRKDPIRGHHDPEGARSNGTRDCPSLEVLDPLQRVSSAVPSVSFQMLTETLIWLKICQVDIGVLSYHFSDGREWGDSRVETRSGAG